MLNHIKISCLQKNRIKAVLVPGSICNGIQDCLILREHFVV